MKYVHQLKHYVF